MLVEVLYFKGNKISVPLNKPKKSEITYNWKNISLASASQEQYTALTGLAQ